MTRELLLAILADDELQRITAICQPEAVKPLDTDFEREPDPVLPRGLQPVEPAAYVLTVNQQLYGLDGAVRS